MQNRAQQADQQRSGRQLRLPALSDRRSLLSRPTLQRNQILKHQDELVYIPRNDISQIPSAIHSTMSHLTFRHMEVSCWQAKISKSISQVDQEVTAVEQVKDVAEGVLQERQVYSQFLSDCMTIGSNLNPADPGQNSVVTELKKEEQLSKESRELLQNQISILLRNISSLKEIHAQLQADFQDKGEAVKLIAHCITCDVNTPCSHLPPAAQCSLNHVSHDEWLTHNKNLKLRAEKLIKDSMSFRGSLQYSWANMKNTQAQQYNRTEASLQRKIHKLNVVKEMLMWEKHQVKEEISDLTKNTEKLEGQIRNCESMMHQANHRLDILNQRFRYELCSDNSDISLMLEKQDLATLVAGFQLALKHTHQNMELALRHLADLEDKLVRNGQHLEVAQKCLSFHQSLLLALDRAVVLAKCKRQHSDPPAVNDAVGLLPPGVRFNKIPS